MLRTGGRHWWVILGLAACAASSPGQPPARADIPIHYDGKVIRFPRWMAFTEDGKHLAVRYPIPASKDEQLTILEVANGRVSAEEPVPLKHEVIALRTESCVVAEKTGRLLYLQDSTLRFIHLPGRQPRPTPGGEVMAGNPKESPPKHLWLDEATNTAYVGYADDGRFALASWSLDKNVVHNLFHTGEVGHNVVAVAANVTARRFAIALNDFVDTSRVECWTVQDKPKKVTITPAGQPWSVALSPDGKTVAVGCSNGVVGWYDTGTGNLVRNVQKLGVFGVHSLAFHPGGEYLVCGTGDRKGLPNLFVVRLATGEVVNRVVADPGGVSALCFSPKGDLFAVYGNDGNIRFWRALALLKLE